MRPHSLLCWHHVRRDLCVDSSFTNHFSVYCLLLRCQHASIRVKLVIFKIVGNCNKRSIFDIFVIHCVRWSFCFHINNAVSENNPNRICYICFTLSRKWDMFSENMCMLRDTYFYLLFICVQNGFAPLVCCQQFNCQFHRKCVSRMRKILVITWEYLFWYLTFHQ